MLAPLSIFAGKRVLVTGDTGFKGSWLSFWLRELKADIVGYALPPKTPEDIFNLLGLEKFIHHIEGDIRDLEGLQLVFDKFQPEFLFHLAAQSLVRLSYKEPKLTFDTNVGGAVNVLEAIRTTESLRSVIFVTSDKCYRNKEWIWGYRENDELGGYDP
jgi:CDP-glucose 4,6-dehydratase